MESTLGPLEGRVVTAIVSELSPRTLRKSVVTRIAASLTAAGIPEKAAAEWVYARLVVKTTGLAP
jgi:hypothetical protein